MFRHSKYKLFCKLKITKLYKYKKYKIVIKLKQFTNGGFL